MKILISAFACDPYQGSEPGVGWVAVCRIARNHEVFVLTDSLNREGWERGKAEGIIPSNIHVRFIHPHAPYYENRYIARLQSWIWFFRYNRKVLKFAMEWHKENKFDLCHQVTIATWRIPSPLWKMPIPFVWGPIGGAAYIPKSFRKMLSPSARAFEWVRDFQTWISIKSKSFRYCIKNTTMVFAANEETLDLLRPYRGDRPMLWLPIVSVSKEKFLHFHRPIKYQTPQGPLRLFAGGNIEGRKGVSLALRALAKVLTKGIDFHYTIAGGGPEIESLRKLAQKLDLLDHITFHPGYSGEDYIRELHKADVYLLPSFRESTPVTLIEAYLAGCYPVVADTSAQGEIVRLVGGHAVELKSIESLIDGLAKSIVWCGTHRGELFPLARKAADKITVHFSSERYESTLNEVYKNAVIK